MSNKVERADAMSFCELLDNLELAVIGQSRVRVRVISGEIVEGLAKDLVTRDGADTLQLDSQGINVRQIHSVAFCE